MASMPLVWYYCGKVHFILFALFPGSGSLGFKLLTFDLGAGWRLDRRGLRGSLYDSSEIG